MDQARPLRFIDLTAEAPADASPQLKSRRALLRTAGLAAFAASSTAAGFAQAADRYDPDGPIVRYPEPDVIGLDPRFKYKLGNTPIVRLYRGTMWAEGRPGTAPGATWCGATFPTTNACAGPKKTVMWGGVSASLPATPTATPSTCKGARSRFATARAT